MNGVTSASDSAGSNQRGAIVIPWTRVICPAGPSARAAENASDVVDAATRVTSTRRNRGGVIRQSPDELLREVLGLHDALGLEVLERERVEADGDRITAADHELGELVAVTAQHRLLVDQQRLHDVVADLETCDGQRPEGRADHARVRDRDLSLPPGIEQVLDALELAVLHAVDV